MCFDCNWVYLLSKILDLRLHAILGAGVFQSNSYKGERYSMARAYLYPAMARPNLHVLTKAHVTKVNIYLASEKNQYFSELTPSKLIQNSI